MSQGDHGRSLEAQATVPYAEPCLQEAGLVGFQPTAVSDSSNEGVDRGESAPVLEQDDSSLSPEQSAPENGGLNAFADAPASPLEPDASQQPAVGGGALSNQARGQELLHLDRLGENEIYGWAYAEYENDETSDEQPSLVLSVGATVLGRRTRALQRPDVDAFLKRPRPLKGYSIPALPAYVLGLLMNNVDELSPVISFGTRSVSLGQASGHLRDISVFRSLKMAEETSSIRLVDVWFVNSSTLRFRVDTSHPSLTDKTIAFRFYQPSTDVGGASRLVLTHEETASDRELGFVTANVENPFLPLLIVAVTTEDLILACDLLPFPSLCRGGVHWAELVLAGTTGSYLSDLRIVGDAIVREMVGWDGAPRRSIGIIEIDLFNATGAEPLFRSDLLAWLAAVFQVKMELLEPTRSKLFPLSDEDFIAAIRDKIALAASLTGRSVDGDYKLSISGRSVPTISALASRRLSTAAGNTRVTMPYVVVDGVTYRPSWCVYPPPDHDLLYELQPRTSAAVAPTLTRLRNSEAAGDLSTTHLPAALTFIEALPANDARRIYPVARDFQEPVLRAAPSQRQRESYLISVLVSVRDRAQDLITLLESLKAQTLESQLEIVVVSNRSNRGMLSWLKLTLARAFPDRNLLIEYDLPFNHSAQTNLAAAHAKHPYLLIANSSAILHDPRTLEVLCQMAEQEMVASAGCMLLSRGSGNGEAVKFRSAGYFPSDIRFLGGPKIAVAEPNCEEALPLATYKTFGNSLNLCMIRRDVWTALGGLDAANFPHNGNDVDYATRTLARGYAHLCTTAVAAFCEPRRTRGSLTDVHAEGFLRTAGLVEKLSTLTVVRKP